MKSNHFLARCVAVTTLALAAGCTTVAGSTNMLSDDRIISESAGVLGQAPADLTLLSRRTAGTNTYATLRGRDKKEYACVINGGNLLSFGMVNPPTCSAK